MAKKVKKDEPYVVIDFCDAVKKKVKKDEPYVVIDFCDGEKDEFKSKQDAEKFIGELLEDGFIEEDDILVIKGSIVRFKPAKVQIED